MKTKTMKNLLAGSVAATLALAISTVTLAAPINYGDFSGGTVMYLDVTETANTPDDSEPLYGPPSLAGDKLDFDPDGFTASAETSAVDQTDGQLNFTLMALPGFSLESLTVSESGAYTLAGSGTAATLIQYALALGAVTVSEVDGVALSTPVALPHATVSGGDNLSLGIDVATAWSLGLTYDIDAALTAASVPFVSGATKLEVVVDNFLVAIREPTSLASVSKFDFMLDVETRPFIPEPTSLALLAGLGLGLCSVSRRRS